MVKKYKDITDSPINEEVDKSDIEHLEWSVKEIYNAAMEFKDLDHEVEQLSKDIRDKYLELMDSFEDINDSLKEMKRSIR